MTSDSFRIDSHKLMYHPERVAQWLAAGSDWRKARKVYPIYMEVSPAGGCNHRCSFCAMDHVGYRNRMLKVGIWKKTVVELAEKGVKSIMFGGEGEPFLNKDVGVIANVTTDTGIQVAFTTNGVLMTPSRMANVLPLASWIKVSMDAGTAKSYAAIHNTREDDFAVLIHNLKSAVKFRDGQKLSCSIGGQLLLLPENVHEVETLAAICRDDIGLDYLVIKPFSQHLHSRNRKYESLEYGVISEKVEKALSLSTEKFKVIYRKNTFEKHIRGDMKFECCQSVPHFWAYIMTNQDVYACSSHFPDERFRLGNLNEQSFSAIWEGEKRRKLIREMQSFDIRQCRVNCRMTFINEYLWELTHPHPHVNFI